MKILRVRRIPKRPYVPCTVCDMMDNWKKAEVLAPNEITFLGAKRTEIWLCDKHLEQLKREAQEIICI